MTTQPVPVLTWTENRQFGVLTQLGGISADDAGPVAMIRRRERSGRAEWEAFVRGHPVPR